MMQTPPVDFEAWGEAGRRARPLSIGLPQYRIEIFPADLRVDWYRHGSRIDECKADKDPFSLVRSKEQHSGAGFKTRFVQAMSQTQRQIAEVLERVALNAVFIERDDG
jgi:hypothetical protein